MKKLYSLLVGVALFSFVANAQVEIREYSGGVPVGEDISGTEFHVNVTADDTYIIHFSVKSLFDTDQYLRARVLEISAPAGWSDGLCWNADPDDLFEGICVDASGIDANPWTTPNVIGGNHGQTIVAGGNALIWPDIHVNGLGVGHYRYYVMPNQGSTPIDSIDLIVERTTLAVEEHKTVNSSLSVYPNPANNVLSVSATGLEGVATVKIVDVLGKQIYSDEITDGTKKIDVSEFKNGVYLLTVTEKGATVRTKRIVVKH